jgi:hypothetical protein
MTERDPNQPLDPAPPARPATPDEAPTVVWRPGRDSAVHEAAPPTPAEPVRPAAGGANRVRWGIALVVTVLMVGVAAAAIFLLTGQTTPSTVVGYAPADSVVYMEMRLDLPGDQRQKLGQFLSKFPGFKDQANLPTKIDESLDRIVLALSSNQQDFTTNIKPWFEGEIAFAVTELPDPTFPASPLDNPEAFPSGRFVVMLSVTDAAKARAWLDGMFAGDTTTAANHAGVDLRVAEEHGTRMAFGVGSAVMFLGDEASVHAAIDTQGNGPLPSSERYKAAIGAFRGDGLGFVYFDMEQYVDWLVKLSESMPGGMGMPITPAQRQAVPDWMAGRLQARGDSLAFEMAFPHVDTPVQVRNRASELAPNLPPSTIVLLDAHDVGDGLTASLDQLRADPSMAETFKQIDEAAALLGGWPGLIGWIRDAGIVVTRTGETIDGGLVFSPKDRAGGERLLLQLRGYATMGGGGAGLDVQVREESYAGATVTTIDFGDWRDIARLTGMGGTVPFEGHLTIAYTATEKVIAIGFGDTFVKAVLDADAGPSLADDARYRSLIDRVGAENAGAGFVDVTAIRELLEALFAREDPTGFATYEREYQPYLVPFDAFVQAARRDDALDRSVGVIVVK